MSEMSVCPFVRPSVKRVDCDKAKEISSRIFTTQGNQYTLVLRHKNSWCGKVLKEVCQNDIAARNPPGIPPGELTADPMSPS